MALPRPCVHSGEGLCQDMELGSCLTLTSKHCGIVKEPSLRRWQTPYQDREQTGANMEPVPSLQPLFKVLDVPRAGMCPCIPLLLHSPSDGGCICMAKHQQCCQPREELLGKSEQWEDFHIPQPPELLPATLLRLSSLRVLNPSSPPLWYPFPCLFYFKSKPLSNSLSSLFLTLPHGIIHMCSQWGAATSSAPRKHSLSRGQPRQLQISVTLRRWKVGVSSLRETQTWDTKLSSGGLLWSAGAPCAQQAEDTRRALTSGGMAEK